MLLSARQTGIEIRIHSGSPTCALTCSECTDSTRRLIDDVKVARNTYSPAARVALSAVNLQKCTTTSIRHTNPLLRHIRNRSNCLHVSQSNVSILLLRAGCRTSSVFLPLNSPHICLLFSLPLPLLASTPDKEEACNDCQCSKDANDDACDLPT